VNLNGHVDPPEEMKLPEMIHAILTSPAFDRAWEECRGIGIGTKENYALVHQRFGDYDFVRDRICETCKEILESADALIADDFEEPVYRKFWYDTLEQLHAVAIAHFIIAIMTGALWHVKATEPEDDMEDC